MATKLQELTDQRVKAVEDARSIMAQAAKEKRDLSPEEEQRWDRFMGEAEKIQKAIDQETRMLDLEARDIVGDRQSRAALLSDDGDGSSTLDSRRDSGDHPGRYVLQTPDEIDAFRRALRGGVASLTPGQLEIIERTGLLQTDLESRAVDKFLRGGAKNLTHDELAALQQNNELRGLQAGDDPSGGYLAMPEQFVNQLIKAIDNQTFIRQLATKYTVPNAMSLGAPALDTDVDDADWTPEIAIASEDTSLAFGKRQLEPHDLSKLIKITRKLVRLVPNIEAFVRERMGYKFGVTMEKACLTGSGSQEPLGLFTASSHGISTSRDVSTDNTTTAFTADGLKNAKYTLKGAYWPRARWLFHRDAMKMLAKLKDGQGQYLWQPSIQMGQPDMLEGIPVIMSEYVPNTFTTGLYVGMIGDFSKYWIVDATSLSIQVLYELYAASNNIGYIGRLASDGMPVLEEAFVRVTLGS